MTATNAQFELGSSATSYTPYNGITKTISLGNTYYGGILNVDSGVLTVDRAMVDLGTLTWVYRPDYAFFYPTDLSITNTNMISDRFATDPVERHATQMASVPTSTMCKQNGYNTLLVKDTRYTNAQDFKTAMNGAQFCYQIATPTTIQLTGEEITALLGENNVWADSGDVEVTYRKGGM